MAQAKKNGNGTNALTKLFELIQGQNNKIEITLEKITLEIQRNRTEVLDKVAEVKERLIKIESRPAHDEFQRASCPNTVAIEEIREIGTKALREYMEKHEQVHKDLLAELRAERQEWKQERLQMTIDSTRKMKWAIIGMIFTAVGAIAVALILHALGLQ